MTEDASLDAFVGGADESDGSDGEDPGAAGTDGQTDGAADEDKNESTAEASPSVAPATSTYVWSPEGGECAECGASVERRWRDDGTLVCADCKEW